MNHKGEVDKTIFLQQNVNQRVGLETNSGKIVFATFLQYKGPDMVFILDNDRLFLLTPRSQCRIVGVKFKYCLS